jgi:predicted nuclease of predicted toxin-antitoxin system
MSSSTDAEILDWARSHNMAVITLDADFHAILSIQHASAPSVVRIRVQGLGGAALARLITEILERYSEELEIGCMITTKKHKTTCRLLAGHRNI